MRRKNKNKNKFQNYKYQLKSSKWKEIRKYMFVYMELKEQFISVKS